MGCHWGLRRGRQECRASVKVRIKLWELGVLRRSEATERLFSVAKLQRLPQCYYKELKCYRQTVGQMFCGVKKASFA